MHIIFEDSAEAPISRLLSNINYGDDINFAYSSSKISTLISTFNDNEDIIVYYDLVPDNDGTILLLNEIVDFVENNVFNKNVYIVPMICIKYILLKMIWGYMKTTSDIGFDIQKVIVNSDKFDYEYLREISSGSSLEKRYKYILNGKLGTCFVNKSNIYKNTKGHKGRFYKYDCDCTKCYLIHKFKLVEKAELLYLNLPMIVKKDINDRIAEKYDIKLQSNDYNSMLKLIYDFYKDMCIKISSMDKMGELNMLFNSLCINS